MIWWVSSTRSWKFYPCKNTPPSARVRVLKVHKNIEVTLVGRFVPHTRTVKKQALDGILLTKPW